MSAGRALGAGERAKVTPEMQQAWSDFEPVEPHSPIGWVREATLARQAFYAGWLAAQATFRTPTPDSERAGGSEAVDDAAIIKFALQFHDEADNGYGAETRRWIKAVRAAFAHPTPKRAGGWQQEQVEDERDQLFAALAMVLFADPGPKLDAGYKYARELWHRLDDGLAQPTGEQPEAVEA